MDDNQRAREGVSECYARVLAAAPPAQAQKGPTVQKGTAVKLAGYTPDQLCTLPRDVVVNSFGCGNPLGFSEVRPGDVVLDLGCGAGIDVLLAAEKVGPAGRAIGVDMTDAMLARARGFIEEAGFTNAEVRKGLIEDLPVESGSIDWVISNCVINLSPQKDEIFTQIARVLKPGGRMLVSDIVAAGIPDRTLRRLDACHSCIAGSISEAAYQAGLRRAGMVDFEIRERIHYDAEHLKRLIESDLRASGGRADCCGQTEAPGSIDELADLCGGKVWSAKIFARKPG